MVLLFNSSIKIKIFFTISPHYTHFSSTFPSLVHTNFYSQPTVLWWDPTSVSALPFHTGTELHVLNFMCLTSFSSHYHSHTYHFFKKIVSWWSSPIFWDSVQVFLSMEAYKTICTQSCFRITDEAEKITIVRARCKDCSIP